MMTLTNCADKNLFDIFSKSFLFLSNTDVGPTLSVPYS